MKVPQAIAEIVSEFSGISRTPDFKAVRSLPNCRCPSPCPNSGESTPTRKESQERERRHSVMITVGTDVIPLVSITPPNGRSTSEHARYLKHSSNSLPAFSSIASTTTLKERLNKIKKRESFEDESPINTRKSSVTYRVI